MKQDPVRLSDDPRVPQTLRDELRAAEDAGPRYDVDAGIRRFSTLAASAAMAGTSASAAAAKGVAKVLPFGVKVVGLVMIGFVGGTVTLRMLSRSSPTVPAGATSAIPPLHARPPSPPSEQPAALAETKSSVFDSPAAVPGKAKSMTPETARRASFSGRPAIAAPAIAIRETTAPTTPDNDALKEEMSQLAEIRSLARSNPARAVELVQEGHARFTRGVFWQERELLAITSLVSLGRQDEARLRATVVLKRHPESPFAESLRRVIATK